MLKEVLTLHLNKKVCQSKRYSIDKLIREAELLKSFLLNNIRKS